jgi:hypothetical protein
LSIENWTAAEVFAAFGDIFGIFRKLSLQIGQVQKAERHFTEQKAV